VSSVHSRLDVGGARPDCTVDPDAASRADALVVPGVGAFGACMRGLRDRALDRLIVEFARAERSVFGVCLGLQVAFDGREEEPDAGLSLLPGTIRRLPDDAVKVPHMGWNEVSWTGDHPFVRGIPTGTRFYFVHSYAADVDPIYTVGETDHAVAFASVVASGSIFATQFHPEKSGEPGLAIYESFVKEV